MVDFNEIIGGLGEQYQLKSGDSNPPSFAGSPPQGNEDQIGNNVFYLYIASKSQYVDKEPPEDNYNLFFCFGNKVRLIDNLYHVIDNYDNSIKLAERLEGLVNSDIDPESTRPDEKYVLDIIVKSLDGMGKKDFVPITRKVNSKQLNTDITLKMSDVPNDIQLVYGDKLSLTYNNQTGNLSLKEDGIIRANVNLGLEKYVSQASVVKDPVGQASGTYIRLQFEGGAPEIYVPTSEIGRLYSAGTAINITDGIISCTLDLSPYYTKSETDSRLATKANNSEVYSKTMVYTKSETDNKIKEFSGDLVHGKADKFFRGESSVECVINTTQGYNDLVGEVLVAIKSNAVHPSFQGNMWFSGGSYINLINGVVTATSPSGNPVSRGVNEWLYMDEILAVYPNFGSTITKVDPHGVSEGITVILANKSGKEYNLETVYDEISGKLSDVYSRSEIDSKFVNLDADTIDGVHIELISEEDYQLLASKDQNTLYLRY